MKINTNQYFLNSSIYLFVLVISIFILLPIFSIFTGILNTNTEYLNFLTNSELSQYIKNSLTIVFFVSLITLFLGVISAYLVSFYNFYGVNFFKYSLLLSFAIPPYIFAYNFSAFFEQYGTLYQLFSLFLNDEKANNFLPKFGPLLSSIISLSLTLFGYVFILSRSSFINQSRNLIEVGKNLGFSNYNNFFKVIVPSSRPAIFVGLSLVAMETLADFGTVSFFGISTFTTGIYNSWFIFDDLQSANLLSFLLLVFILTFFYLENFSRKNLKYYVSSQAVKKTIEKTNLKGFKEFSAFLFCLSLFSISFLFPLFQMFSWALSSSTYFNNNELIELNFNSIKLILISSLLIISLSFFVNFGIRTIKSRLLKICSSLSISGYAIPGIVISVAIISFFSFIDNQFNINIKKYFIGSIAGLVLGYCIRFYSISFNSIKTVYMKINKSIDESALLLGFNKLKILKNIHFPLLKKNFIFAFLLISIEIIKELPITLILRPFNFETFSTKAFNYASNDLIEAASIPSLFIIFWSTVLIFLSIKFFLMDKK